MDAPPNGPEEGLLFLTDANPRNKRALLVTSLELLGASKTSIELEVAGNSMIPTLRPSDRVRVDLRQRLPRFGDVIVFAQGDSIVVHRFLGHALDRKGRRCLRSRGDGRRELDSPLAPESVVGTARAVHRDGTWRRLDGIGGRAYGAAVALHDLFWAGAIHVASRLGGKGLAGAVAKGDRFLIKVADWLLFRLVHSVVPAGEAARGYDPR